MPNILINLGFHCAEEFLFHETACRLLCVWMFNDSPAHTKTKSAIGWCDIYILAQYIRVQQIGIGNNVCEVLYLLHTFVCYENNICYYIHKVLEIFCIKSKYKGYNSVKKRRGDSPLKCSGMDFTCANTDIVLHSFDVCIGIVRLIRYIINVNKLTPAIFQPLI